MNPLFVLIFCAILPLFACSPRLIGDTKIVDTKENREILRLMDRYKAAMNNMNPKAILELVSKRYFENSGTSEGIGNYSYDGLVKILDKRFKQLTDIKFKIRVERIEVRKNTAYVYYTYFGNFRYMVHGKEYWKFRSENDRMVLTRETEGWKFVHGL